jgi:hypothetical protein
MTDIILEHTRMQQTLSASPFVTDEYKSIKTPRKVLRPL